ncbi:MAG: EAL domain-containing protein [Gammaproteobacteria bacterium]|nr:EAL domain-containing protein [Gammaproteobacteria bacterium]
MSPDDEINFLRQQLQQREVEIALLKEATDAVSSQLDLKTVMQIIADRARILLNAKTLLIPVLSEDCDEYTYVAGSGENTDEIIGESLPLDFGICGWVWKHKRAWWHGVLDELEENERNRWEQEAGSVIMVPLFGKTHFLGGLAGINKTGADYFDKRDLELLTMFASQVSIAIENAMAYQKLQENKKELENLALYDQLTGLPNRKLIRDLITEGINKARQGKHHASVLLIDLDNFKEFNDTLGHDLGDRLITEIAHRFQQQLGPSGHVGRLGGDEFAVLIQHDTPETIIQTAQGLLQTLEQPVKLHDIQYFMAASIGIATYPEHGKDLSSLLQHADVAMYTSKKEACGYSIYDPDKDKHSQTRLALTGELRKACKQKKFHFHYQPKLDTRTGKIISAEALARWFHPEFGKVGPDIFIPILEKTGLIKRFTSQLLHEALQQCHFWHQAGLNLSVAVNMSMHNLHDPELPQLVSRLLHKWKLPRNSLILEITESVAMGDQQHLPTILAQLVLSGVELSIDDFGTGYSSLSYLKKLPLSELKIDKSFVIDMDKDPDNAVIVRSTVELAHNLGMRVVAEGIENQQTLAQLTSMGTDILQGYEISYPLEADKFIAFVQNRQLPRSSQKPYS